MDFQNFTTMEFEPASEAGFVYVLCLKNGAEGLPFYVGQTQSIWGRLNDYYWADFQASTDFRVGEAIKHLASKGIRVTVRYRPSAERRAEESHIIRELHNQGRMLLNDCPGYDYRTADQEKERMRVCDFMDRLSSS